MSVELVLAPGVTDSASSLSYPYANELVNSAIKAWVYTYAGDEDRENFSALGAFGVFYINTDFRKRLRIVTHFYVAGTGPLPVRNQVWGCRCRDKWYVRASITWISLADFDVNKFKLVSASPL